MDEDDFEYGEDNLFVSFKTTIGAMRVIDRELQNISINLKLDVVDGVGVSRDDPKALFKSQVAMIKMRYWLSEILEGSLIFNRDNEWAVDIFFSSEGNRGASNNLVILPGEPTEDILVQILQSKLSALGGGHLLIGNLDLEISDGHGLSFTYVGQGEDELPAMDEWIGDHTYFSKPWWARDDASTIDITPDEDSDLGEAQDFAYSLNFLADQLVPSNDAPSASIIRPNFNPKVILGGKED
jgi:hypothetical protein